MNYQDLVRDFAQRTKANLELIRRLQVDEYQVYEVTALINSMLGLLVFPEQRFFDSIPQTPIQILEKEGWPIPEVLGEFPQVTDLRQLLRYLRNAISHCNIKFEADDFNEITGVILWNTDPRQNGKMTWQAKFSASALERITSSFITIILIDTPQA